MKVITAFSLTVFIFLSHFNAAGQVTDSINKKNEYGLNSKEFFLRKSENQKTTGQILLIGGTGLTIGGFFVAAKGDGNLWTGLGNLLLGGTMIGAGIVADLISIPFFISASKNKKKAAAITLIQEKMDIPGNVSSGNALMPSVAIRIPL